jgi:hypothetical protein
MTVVSPSLPGFPWRFLVFFASSSFFFAVVCVLVRSGMLDALFVVPWFSPSPAEPRLKTLR